MDDIDRANALAERERQAAIAARKPEGPRATGRCLWCDTPLELSRRFCGPECRDDWEADNG